MLGAIIGDIVGSRFEFSNVRSDNFLLFTKDCDFTDDTICTVAVADAILNKKSYQSSMQEWCKKYPNPMGGYGGSFVRWVHSENPQPYNSWGNGSAMRVSAVGWLFNDTKSIEREATKSAEITHSHEEGIKGAVTIAKCIYMLRNGASKEVIKAFVESLYGTLPRFRYFSNPFNESCMNAVPVSVACFLASEDFESAIRNAILVGGDSDTIGAITGSLAEAYYIMNNEMRDTALSYLPDDIKLIVKQFELRK